MSAVQGTLGDAVRGDETRRKEMSGDRAAIRTGVQADDDEGRQNVVVLTPEGCQFIGVRAYDGSELTVVSRAAAVLYGTHRVVLPRPLMLKGPAGTLVRVTEDCIIVFPLGDPQGRKMEIYAMVVDSLEEYYGVPQGSMWKWQVQLGIETRRRDSTHAASCAAR
jgi:hypothetical protein